MARVLATGLPEGWSEANNDWVLEFCNVSAAWKIPPKPGGKSKGEGIVIAHPDVGYTTHPEIMRGGRLLFREGKNFVDGEGRTPEDYLIGCFPFTFPCHGTKTAGTIMSAEGHPFTPPVESEFEKLYVRPYTETAWVTGVAPLATLVPYKVGTSVVLEEADCAHIAAAIYHAISLQQRETSPLDVAVMSISMGRPFGMIEHSLEQALIDAREAGIVVCAAAAQTDELLSAWGWSPADLASVAFPGCDPNVIGCAACDFEHKRLEGAFYGPEVDITAPGKNVWYALTKMVPPLEYSVHCDGTGTSYATAMVAGACVLWQAHHGRANLIRDYTRPKIFPLFKKVLQSSCHKPDTWEEWDFANRGAGVLDVKALLEAKLPSKDEL